MTETPREITRDDMDAILPFLPVFDTPGFVFGRWEGGKALKSRKDATQFFTSPSFVASDEATAFVKALGDHGWIVPFDWRAWQPEAERYVADPALVDQADAQTLRKLLTTHVRKDHSSKGLLLKIHQNGHLTAILRRLAALRDKL